MKRATLFLAFIIATWMLPVNLMAQINTTSNAYEYSISLFKQGTPYKHWKNRPRMPQAPVTNLLGMDESCFYVYPVADVMSVTINLYDEEENIKWTCTESANDGNTVTIPYPGDMNGVYIVELLLDDCAYTGRIEIE